MTAFDAVWMAVDAAIGLVAATILHAAATATWRAIRRQWRTRRTIAHLQRSIDLHLDHAYARIAHEIRKEQQ